MYSHRATLCIMVVEPAAVLRAALPGGTGFGVFVALGAVAGRRLWTTTPPTAATFGALRRVVWQHAHRCTSRIHCRDARPLRWYGTHPVRRARRCVWQVRAVADVAVPFATVVIPAPHGVEHVAVAVVARLCPCVRHALWCRAVARGSEERNVAMTRAVGTTHAVRKVAVGVCVA